jgi:hypothetical protein
MVITSAVLMNWLSFSAIGQPERFQTTLNLSSAGSASSQIRSNIFRL